MTLIASSEVDNDFNVEESCASFVRVQQGPSNLNSSE